MKLGQRIIFILLFIYVIFAGVMLLSFYVMKGISQSDQMNFIKNQYYSVFDKHKDDLTTEIYLNWDNAVIQHLERLKNKEGLDKVLLATKQNYYGDNELLVVKEELDDNTFYRDGEKVFFKYTLNYLMEPLGNLYFSINIGDIIGMPWLQKNMTLITIGYVLLFLITTIIVYIYIVMKIVRPIKGASGMIANISEFQKGIKIDNTGIKEVDRMLREISLLRKRLFKEIENNRKYIAEASIGKISSQVAHDIRSPLSALNVAAQDLKLLPEEQRIMIRSAVQRIDDIANDLASKKTEKNKKSEKKDENYNVYLLSSLIESIISEKRLQFRSKMGISIESRLNKDSYGLFAKIKAVEFKRVLSNLINNAVEAMDVIGKVRISMYAEGLNVYIKVADNGKGIPKDILPKLMGQGASFGKDTHKDSGSGLGLYHAKQTIKDFYGDLNIDSEEGKGTTLTITLPKVEAPDWFVPEIGVEQFERMVILDDDESIHQVWNGRFDGAKINRDRIEHFTAPEDLVLWGKSVGIRDNNEIKSKYIFLCDYELIGKEMNGLQVIEKLGIQGRSVLVTSHFEEEPVRNECKRLGVKLLPKNLAGFVPIICEDGGEKTENRLREPRIANRNTREENRFREEIKIKKQESRTKEQKTDQLDAVLIDNDELIRTTWKLEGKIYKKKVETYESPKEFFQNIENIDKNTEIYVDSNIGEDIKGEEISKEIYNMGFKRIYLTTGYKKEQFTDMPWIKDILGKDPPFRPQKAKG